MGSDPFVFSFFLIFACAGILATLALFTRQPLIVMYIVTGMILGPSGTALIDNPELISSIAKFGIIFLLFLLGLDMQPAKLIKTLRSAMLVGIGSSLVFFAVGFLIASAFGYSATETIIIGIAMMFSSTIIGIKLLPTTVLHHRHTGELMISLLLIQDLMAIIVLLVITGGLMEFDGVSKIASVLVSLPLLLLFSWLFVKYVLLPLLEKFDAFHEYIFLVAIAWCLGMAELSELTGLSLEIGAFIAGVTIATSPIALYIADHLKPLRDFFLVLFFFSIGAGFHMDLLAQVILPAAVIAAVILSLKPVTFKFMLRRMSETSALGWETGFRLGQISEFSLLIAFVATAQNLISQEASHLIQATAILTFLASSYLVVFRYPTPIAVNDRLRRD
ncbi:MAG: cation:proton antiporter [Gammaproteobacteria bacterium]|jgi:Kef-type K+ transport system membrane component KefB|nr:cation:proton antiporter [Gammaproteobacteria bacterium]MBT5153904.1 cation:proton antiporter [Gammaproteobacteria bacterium]MBT5684901.1 cation:proton antiporter [Gammaproteobacteria bacterium]MBT5724518.1 cation:proton antiporter [Gammaproteobacteria bacterium]MBT6584434.1 cation:proton antiporter [Gammaproteobacteria bacterium]